MVRYRTRDRELTRPLVAGVVRRGRQGLQGVQVPLHPLADTLRVAPEPGVHARQAALLQVGVQRLKTLEGRHRHQEVAPHVAHLRGLEPVGLHDLLLVG